jgi:phage tail-like protein
MAQGYVTGKRKDPYRQFGFRVIRADGTVLGAFHKVSGLHAEIEVTDYREGDEAARVRKIPGLASFDNIVLERGIDTDNIMYNWFRKVFNLFGQAKPDDEFRDDIFIILLDHRGIEVKRWKCYECWPAVYEADDLDAQSSDILFERIELANEGWEPVETGVNVAKFVNLPF